jgi:hypothetical protein
MGKGQEREDTFDVMINTIQILVTMTAWFLIGLIAAVVVAFCKVGIEYVFLTPLVALLIGWVICMVNVGKNR